MTSNKQVAILFWAQRVNLFDHLYVVRIAYFIRKSEIREEQQIQKQRAQQKRAEKMQNRVKHQEHLRSLKKEPETVPVPVTTVPEKAMEMVVVPVSKPVLESTLKSKDPDSTTPKAQDPKDVKHLEKKTSDHESEDLDNSNLSDSELTAIRIQRDPVFKCMDCKQKTFRSQKALQKHSTECKESLQKMKKWFQNDSKNEKEKLPSVPSSVPSSVTSPAQKSPSSFETQKSGKPGKKSEWIFNRKQFEAKADLSFFHSKHLQKFDVEEPFASRFPFFVLRFDTDIWVCL